MRAGGNVSDRRTDARRRLLDVAVSSLLLLITLPVILLAALGSAISLRAWPFFTQERIGRHGESFRFLKVRTLPVDTPGYVDKHQLDTTRIPGFCLLLRRLHLDELPQLLLVLRGHMSLVGPRPEMAYLHRHMAPDFAELRTSVRPGCTGLWQISDGCTDLIGRTPEYDRYYLAQRSLQFDLWVLYRTALKMLGLGRTVTLRDIPPWASRDDEPDEVIDLDAEVAPLHEAASA
jgi:lipopolysaccharide/colanic/teichoic acid biosynthesis glycosyltransferase